MLAFRQPPRTWPVLSWRPHIGQPLSSIRKPKAWQVSIRAHQASITLSYDYVLIRYRGKAVNGHPNAGRTNTWISDCPRTRRVSFFLDTKWWKFSLRGAQLKPRQGNISICKCHWSSCSVCYYSPSAHRWQVGTCVIQMFPLRICISDGMCELELRFTHCSNIGRHNITRVTSMNPGKMERCVC